MAVAYDCLTALQTQIRALGIVEDADVRVQKLPWNRLAVSTGIFITPLAETVGPGTNVNDEVTYSFQITMIQASNQSLTSDFAEFTNWREEISQTLRQNALSGVASVYTVRVEPMAVYLPEAFAKMYDVGALTVQCVSREPNS